MKPGGNVEWSLQQVRPGLWKGAVTVHAIHPGSVMPLRKQALAPDKASALEAAAAKVAGVAANPILRAVMPPGTSNAIAAIGLVSKAARSGALGAVVGKLKGVGAKRLARALGF